MLKARLFEGIALLLLAGLLLLGRSLAARAAEHEPPATPASEQRSETGDDFDFFSNEPVTSAAVVQLPAQKPAWIRVGGPLALFGFFALLLAAFWYLVPFRPHTADINLRDMPTGVQRGIAMATVLFGIAFTFGASEIGYQLQLHGSTAAYFEQMSLGKLIAFTHAHLFGFTTSFFIIGIPFSLQFNHLWPYQWVFPIGLSASVTDVISWWGIKYVTPGFEAVSIFCGILFSLSYLFMLVALLRVLLLPEVIWRSDKDRRERLERRRQLREASEHHEGDY